MLFDTLDIRIRDQMIEIGHLEVHDCIHLSLEKDKIIVIRLVIQADDCDKLNFRFNLITF